jgi:hypothetical protein
MSAIRAPKSEPTMSSTAIHAPPGLSRSKLLALLALFASAPLIAAAALAPAIRSPISCERHEGDFRAGDFSAGFDIDRIDCRLDRIKHSPTLHVFAVAPFFSVQ